MLELIKRITNVDATEIHDNLTLPYELRMRGRLRTTTETSQDVGLFLDRGPYCGMAIYCKPEPARLSAFARRRARGDCTHRSWPAAGTPVLPPG